jgi:hypothetical protein
MPNVIMTNLASVTNSASFTASADFDYSLSGTFVATVALQTSFDNGSTWVNMTPALTAAAIGTISHKGAPRLYRFACSLFTSGAIVPAYSIKDN